MTASPTIDRPLKASLFELGLRSQDPARLAEFYRTAMGYRFSDGNGSLVGAAQDRRLSIAEGASRTLAYAAYAVPDAEELDALSRRLKGAGSNMPRSTWPDSRKALCRSSIRTAITSVSAWFLPIRSRWSKGARLSRPVCSMSFSRARR